MYKLGNLVAGKNEKEAKPHKNRILSLSSNTKWYSLRLFQNICIIYIKYTSVTITLCLPLFPREGLELNPVICVK